MREEIHSNSPFSKGELPTHLEKEPKIMPLFGKEGEGEIL
jgi:hypothetical protein